MKAETKIGITIGLCFVLLVLCLGRIFTDISKAADRYNTCRKAGGAPDICLSGGIEEDSLVTDTTEATS